MTDEQIIKALECCVKTEFISGCAKCEMFAFDCKDILIENALDLINRQAAEIEELKTEIERMENQNTLLLKKKCKDINTARKIIKSEAIKDFAERLKKEVLIDSGFEVLQVGTIDNLVKEMTEGK